MIQKMNKQNITDLIQKTFAFEYPDLKNKFNITV